MIPGLCQAMQSTTILPRVSQDQDTKDASRDVEASVIDRVATATSQVPPVERATFEIDTAPQPSKPSQIVITCLVILCNLTQFISMFSTVAGGFQFSAELGREFGPGQANWMGAAYSLTQSAFVLISGRLGAIYGHQNMLFLGGGIIVVFSLGNAFCKTYESFVAMRAMTGIGGGIIMPNAVAVLTIMIPPGQSRNITLAAFAASPPCGALVGALLAGVFLEYTEWKWFFIVIAILGTVMFGSLFLVLPHDEPVDKGGSIDYLGIVFSLGGLLLFNFAWNQSPSIGWDSPSVISTIIVSLLLFIAFMVWESKFAKEPIMPLTVFAAPTFTALIFVALLTYMSVGISLWYMVAWQQLLRNWTVLHVAIGWIPYAVGASMSVGLAAWLIPRIEAQSIMAIGILASIVSCLLLATMPEQQIYWAQTFPSILIGSLCPDFVYVAAQIIASNSVGKREQGVAGSLIGTLNLYGNSLGLGFAGTIESQLIKNGASHVTSFRAALYFAMALSAAALVLDFGFIRMPKDDRKGWEQDNSRRDEDLQDPESLDN
ncbi:efflux pump antibiotic resistance [Colletotrichum chrysophilum]|uniref:Efflux pump antibiotic resistance n=1 Tax=Colletotrichum chrysophilum TaxID=1836956 RepID=A0AAD9ASI3_9PEZI|nr:efflux pump antibiotic resistance [Colletotrichum chrysophilum]